MVNGGFSRNGSPASLGVMRLPDCSMLYAMSYSRGSSGVQMSRSNMPMPQVGSNISRTSSGQKRSSFVSTCETESTIGEEFH
jgi:hypothetical protein